MKFGKELLHFFSDLNLQLISLDKYVNSISKSIEEIIQTQIIKFKAEITKTVLFLIFMLLTLIFLSVGTIIYLERFFPLDYLLLVFGGVFAFITLIIKLVS